MHTATTIHTLSVGNNVAAGTFTYSGVIQNNVALAKQGGATMTLTKDNTFVGTTTVNGGTVEVQGRLSGTSGVNVNPAGTFLLNSSTNADNIVNPSADVNLASGTLRIDNSKTGTTQTLCNLTLSGSPIVDFGTGTTDKLVFQRLVTNLNLLGGTLQIWNWTGSVYAVGTMLDSNDPTQDRFLFNTDLGFGNGGPVPNVKFYSDSGITQIGDSSGQVQFGPQFEIVPVPEPATTALLGTVALCALLGRRRHSADVRHRLARK